MPHDEGLAHRIREMLDDGPAYVEKKMFGGLSFMVNGNMSVGITSDDLVVRVGKENDAEALSHPHTRPMDFTGKPMKGWIYVAPEGYASDEDLLAWIQRGLDFALSLPPK
ncbi:MAG: TfoX/Sxy family protein [Anaerolineae bacterium]|nr:TfoX/Sxy family protein [Anaerolineae bacterium]